MDDHGLESAAILLMSLGEEEASEVFKHLAPKEVQRLGETIARMKAVSRERVEQVIDKFTTVAAEQHMLVADTDEYVKSVLRKALGDDKANLLIDRIMQGSDVSGLESLKWMDASSVAELLRNEHPQIVAAILAHLEFDQAYRRRQRVARMRRLGPIDHEWQRQTERPIELRKGQRPFQQHSIRTASRHVRHLAEFDAGGTGLGNDLAEWPSRSHAPGNERRLDQIIDPEGQWSVQTRLGRIRPDHLEIGVATERQQFVVRAVADVTTTRCRQHPEELADRRRGPWQIPGGVHEMVDHVDIIARCNGR